MKTQLYALFFPAMLTFSVVKVTAQSANLELSNLSPVTAVNRTLLPKTDSASNLGSAALGWRNIYLANALYLKKRIAMQQVGTTNFFVGPLAGRTSATGTYNFGSGISSLFSLTSGSYNTASGFESLFKNTGGSYNSALGFHALYKNTTGISNTATGYSALVSNTTGGNNTANGTDALHENTTGGNNTASGLGALYQNTTGGNNTANGVNTLHENTTGGNNTANGLGALYYNTTGYDNTATGLSALRSNTTGIHNTADGVSALASNTVGNQNTANGWSALGSNISGSSNTANGFRALASNARNSWNTATGWNALANDIDGYDNTANGWAALLHNTTGLGNTATGSGALIHNTTGSNNTAVGESALSYNVEGKGNTAVGSSAFLSRNFDAATGNISYTSALGYLASIYGFREESVVINSTAIGAFSEITASNQVRIGDPNITSIGGYVNWSNISDGRFKKNVTESVTGLAFINKLKPVVYNLDITGIQSRFADKPNSSKLHSIEGLEAGKSLANQPDGRLQQATAAKEKIRYSGFVAQDVEKAAKEVGYEFSGVDAPKNEKDLYGLRYADFVVPLVKAVQELSVRGDSLLNINQQLQQKLSETEARLDRLEALMKGTSTAGGSGEIFLGQNTPNPFKGTTRISYALPQQFSNARLVLYDVSGKALKQWALTGPGKGTLSIDAVSLASGAYSYSLVVDGRIADSKKMILAR